MKTLFISDTHLGSRHAHTKQLLEYLDRIKGKNAPDKLYIVGDFIDGWKLSRNWYWDDQCTLIIRKIMTLIKKGTEVIYVAGNHDEFLRKFIHEFDGSFGSIKFVDEIIHTTADGRKLLVVHGDKFDASIKYAKWLCVLGDIGYDFLIKANYFVNWFRKNILRKKSHWSLSKSIKSKVKQAVNYISDFEEFLTRYAESKGCEGVVCGHIHTPDMRQINGVWYYNTGDWMETCSAIVEEDDGSMNLYDHLK